MEKNNFMKKMNTNVIYKKVRELKEGTSYEILAYDLKFIESLGKHILNVTIICDGNKCSVGLPDKIRKNFEAQGEFEREYIVGSSFQYKIKTFYSLTNGEQVTYYDVTVV
jgi:hypothetical protein